MSRLYLADLLLEFARDFDAAGQQYAGLSLRLRQAAEGQKALQWIAQQPTIGPGASWWDMRTKARVALDLPPVALSPEEQALQDRHKELNNAPLVGTGGQNPHATDHPASDPHGDGLPRHLYPFWD